MAKSFMVKFKGDLKDTKDFFKRFIDSDPYVILNRYGKAGIQALQSATPRDTGITADSWNYKIEKNEAGYKLIITNDHLAGSSETPVVILLQYGHVDRNGAYLSGVDFINPAIKPIFDEASEVFRREVIK